MLNKGHITLLNQTPVKYKERPSKKDVGAGVLVLSHRLDSDPYLTL